jgi:hypothetical protein
MDRLNKLIASFATLGAIVGATLAAEDRYAKDADLAKKVDVHVVHRMQRVFILDRVHNLEDDQFLIEQKPILNSLDLYRLNKIKSRIELLSREINGVPNDD